MRVFHLSANVFQPLPGTHHTLAIWKELSRGAREYHVIASAGALSYSHSKAGRIHLHLLPTLGRRAWAYTFSSWMILLLALVYRPNRIVAQCPVHGGLVGAFLAWIAAIPMLCEVHGSHYFRVVRPGWLGRIEHAFYVFASGISFRLATAVRSLSQQMSLEIGKIYGERIQSKTLVIPNRVDMSVFFPPKTTYKIESDVKIVAVGSYVPVKNHLALIRDVFAAQPKARLTIVGSGTLGSEYRKLAESIGCSERLTLVKAASHREVAALLAQSDIFVHYSLTEGVPRALLEAMAMGLPTVSSDVGYIGDFAIHGTNTLILGRAGALTLDEAMSRLAGSLAYRRSIGVSAHDTIKKKYEWSVVFEQYRNVISSLGNKNSWK